MIKKLLLALALIFAAGAAQAANCASYPFTLTNGSTADANQVMANFNTVLSCSNTNLAHNGANSDITSLTGLTTPISVAQGGTGLTTVGATGSVLVSNGSGLTANTLGNGLTISGSSIIANIGNGLTTSTGATVVNAGNGLQFVSGALATNLPLLPQGRLTLVTAVPVMVTNVAGATSIFYTPYLGNQYPWYDGTEWTVRQVAQLTLALDSNAAHTGYAQSGKNFDLCLYNNAGTDQLVSMPAWSSDTARSSNIVQLAGIWVNQSSVTVKFDTTSGTETVPGNECTYVGTFRASANGQTTWTPNPAPAAGGGNALMLVWNCYNRIEFAAYSEDNTDSWNYGSASWRAANTSTSNRVSMVKGLNEDAVTAIYYDNVASPNGSSTTYLGLGVDSTTAPFPNGMIGIAQISTGGSPATELQAQINTVLGLGFHFVQALENTNGNHTFTYFGDNGVASEQYQALMLQTRG